MNIQYRRDLWKLFADGYLPSNSAEIGVAEGFFSRDILSWPVQFPVHYMVDRWQTAPVKGDSSMPQAWHDGNLTAAKLRVKEFGERARILQGESSEMSKLVPDRSLSLLYIDGDHSYAGVMSDLLHWVPKVHLGGYVALHDYENPAYGVKAALQEFCRKTHRKIHLLPEDKPEDAGAYFLC